MTVGMTPDIAVVVPTYRRDEGALKLLDALEAQTLGRARFEVVVVDDCSPGGMDRLTERVAGSPLQARFLRTPRNGGPAAARNLGWRSSAAPYLAFVDDDCLPSPGWLAAGVAALDADPNLGVVQGRTDQPAGARHGDWTVYREVHGPTAWFESTNIFFRRDALAAAGGFDEELRFYFEDTAAGWGVLAAGWGRGYADDALVVHDVEERGVGWRIRNGLTERNAVVVARRYPGFREAAFFRPWAFRRENAAVALAWAGVAGAVAAQKVAPLALALPWLVWQRPPSGHHRAAALWLERFAVDSAQLAGHLRGSLAARTLVL